MANVNPPPNANANQPNPLAWRDRMPLNMDPPLHDIPKHPKKELPKFDHGKGISVEEHLQSFYLDL